MQSDWSFCAVAVLVNHFGVVSELLRVDGKLLWCCWASALVLWVNCFQRPGELRFSKPCVANKVQSVQGSSIKPYKGHDNVGV